MYKFCENFCKRLLVWKFSEYKYNFKLYNDQSMPERIYNPIAAMGFSAMFIFQLDNTNAVLDFEI